MGERGSDVKVLDAPPRREVRPVPRWARRTRPRSYLEWKTLRRWEKLPPWEPLCPGYLLRLAREEAELTQAELAEELGVTQQAIARAERWDSNPTVRLMERWAEACGNRLRIELMRP
ncbi:MAG: helix-turn-helix transcriptional regulator [bacterium]